MAKKSHRAITDSAEVAECLQMTEKKMDSPSQLHAFGVGSDPLVGGIGHADTCQQRFCTRFRFIAAKTIELPCKKKVLPSGHIGIKANIVWQIADGPLDFYSFSGAVKTQNGSIA